jgi:6-phosphogluconolactonase
MDVKLLVRIKNMYRVTVTHPVANHAARVAFLVSGENKVNALHEVLYGDYNPSLYPSQIIKPISGELHWFLDEAAAKE